MNHIQISIKFDEDTHHEIAEITDCMRMNKHAFVVNSVKETLKMIKDRGKEQLPLLVAQARTAEDHARAALPLPLFVVQAQTAQKFAQEAPALPIRSDASPPTSTRKSRCEGRGKGLA